jgi:hypothetical protein
MSSTPFMLGAYVGDPDGSDAADMANFTADYASYASLMGTAPQMLDYYGDYTHPVNQWVGDAGWQSWSANQSPDSDAASGTTPVIALPMYSNAAGSLSPDAQYQAIISGQDDSVIEGIVDQWASAGFKTQVYRPGWEFNLQGPTYAGDTAQDQSDWVAAFQHIYTVLHTEAAKDGVSLSVVWNPGATNYSNVSATALYPGNSYVDSIGVDMYSDMYPYSDGANAQGQPTYHDFATGGEDTSLAQWMANPVNRESYWSNPAETAYSSDGSGGHAESFDQLLQFAEQQGKPFSVPETGAGNTGTDVTDDPQFPQWLSEQLAAAQASGETISFVNVWDSNGGGNYEFSNASDNKPMEAAAWAKYFGVQPTTAAGTGSAGSTAGGSSSSSGSGSAPIPATNPVPPPITVGTGNDQLVLDMSEDAYQGSAQVAISVDGVQVGGTLTLGALHAQGQDQVVDVQGNWGDGAHTLGVDFLNDDYGGSSSTDRNAYVDGASYDGVPASGALALMSGGTQSLQVGSAAPGATVLGSGRDTISLEMAQDYFQGTAQFTLSVDGTQVGGTQTLTASQAAGQTQAFQVEGGWGAGQHSVSVDFLNDLYQPGVGDRNLSVDGASYDGTPASGSLALMGGGTQSMTVGTPLAAIVATGTRSAITTPASAPVSPFAGVAISDPNVDQTETATVTLGTGASGTLADPKAASDGSTLANGVYSVTGSAAAVATALDTLVFTPASGQAAGTSVAIGVTAGIADSSGKTVSLSSVVTSTAPAAPALPSTVTVGSGPDTVSLKVSEDAYQGDAQFTVSVDGQQVGGVQTAQDSHSGGLDQTFDVQGSWGAGQHEVSVDFLNDLYQPGLGDRNLYVDGAGYDGVAASPGTLALMGGGPQSLTVGTPIQSTLALYVSEDAYQGDAQFTVDVDGKQVGGTMSADALHSSGDQGVFLLTGGWNSGTHDVKISFLNDLYAGTPQTDRNLYVNGIALNGQMQAESSATLMSTGSADLTVGDSTPVVASPSDTVVLNLSEDAWQGDAQFSFTVDGKAVGTPQPVTALHSTGASQDFEFTGNFGAGSHTLGVSFTNDAYGGSPSTDRNLYVGSVSVNGQSVGSPATLLSSGTVDYTATTAH